MPSDHAPGHPVVRLLGLPQSTDKLLEFRKLRSVHGQTITKKRIISTILGFYIILLVIVEEIRIDVFKRDLLE